MMGTAEAELCQKENESTTPCSVRGRQCGIDDLGNCVADGICCVEGESRYTGKPDAVVEVEDPPPLPPPNAFYSDSTRQ